ncbi:MAG: hypothetical protein WEA09_10290 [Gemmatimonadota bacterium]
MSVSRLLTLPWALLLMGACGSDEPPPLTIPSETFVDVYVDLRASVLLGESDEVDPEERDAILEHHGVTPEDLRFFVEVHGEDVSFMTDVWDRVEERLSGWGQDVPSES